MSRRARAIGFLVSAGACALLAAVIVSRYGDGVAAQLGELRPVVVATTELRAGRAIRPRDAAEALELRRIPARSVASDALMAPEEAIGQVPAAPIPAGSYIVASQLQVSPPEPERGPDLGRGRSAVDIAVAGGGALLAAGGRVEGSKVDAVVTSERGVSGRGETVVAAEGVELLALVDGAGGSAEGLPGPPQWTATLALSRDEALRLIQAESFARQIRLLPRSPGVKPR